MNCFYQSVKQLREREEEISTKEKVDTPNSLTDKHRPISSRSIRRWRYVLTTQQFTRSALGDVVNRSEVAAVTAVSPHTPQHTLRLAGNL